MCVYECVSLSRAHILEVAERDGAVEAGRRRYTAHWYCVFVAQQQPLARAAAAAVTVASASLSRYGRAALG